MRVGLLFGGKSFEHDISIITANIIYHSIKDKYEVLLLYIDKEGKLYLPKEMIVDDFVRGKNYKKFNFVEGGIKKHLKKIKLEVIISAMHGLNGEDGLSAFLSEFYNIPYVGSNRISSGILMDKYFTYAVLHANKIKTISTKYYFKNDKIDIKKLPIIVKPARLGSSIGIKKISNIEELNDGISHAFKFDEKIIIQPYIESFRECNQGAFKYNGKIELSNIEEVYKSKDILSFDDKYIQSKVQRNRIFICDELLINKISELTEKIYKLFDLSGVVRIDYMIIDGEVYVNEVNTIPGSLAYYLFDEAFDIIIDKMIKTAIFDFQNKKDFVFKSSVLQQKYSYKK